VQGYLFVRNPLCQKNAEEKHSKLTAQKGDRKQKCISHAWTAGKKQHPDLEMPTLDMM
jgi:hypothetical protein